MKTLFTYNVGEVSLNVFTAWHQLPESELLYEFCVRFSVWRFSDDPNIQTTDEEIRDAHSHLVSEYGVQYYTGPLFKAVPTLQSWNVRESLVPKIGHGSGIYKWESLATVYGNPWLYSELERNGVTIQYLNFAGFLREV